MKIDEREERDGNVKKIGTDRIKRRKSQNNKDRNREKDIRYKIRKQYRKEIFS